MNKITYLQEKNSSRKIEELLGKSKKTGIKGSTAYFIKEIIFQNGDGSFPNDAKGIFEYFEKGVLLHAFKSTSNYFIPLPFSTLNKIILTKGKESVNLIFLSPMWTLLKVGLSIDLARYFALGGEYKIEETTLEIISENLKMRLITNGYAFKGQERFFSQLEIGGHLEINKTIPILK
ncbi:MAG: hypothetical protein RLO12_24120 [Fulvivirga sp.]|uniref:hypothetical protein n=1 Tax=Fulvivirga sp. TaxID=1931237 RepID=UPI0032F7C771